MQRKQFNLKREFVRRRELNLAGLKIGPNQAYLNAWVIREGQGDGQGPIRHYALTEEEACTWVDAREGAEAKPAESAEAKPAKGAKAKPAQGADAKPAEGAAS